MLRGETPSLAEVIKQAIEVRLATVHVSMPGIVQKYDATKQQADVQPCLQRRNPDNSTATLPIITNVPVVWPRAGKSIVHLPMTAGDTVTLVFSERSLDKWLDSGGIVDPADPRKHHLSDAVAIPGLFPFSKPAVIEDPKSLTLQNDQSRITLKPDGKLKVETLADAEELITVLFNWIDSLMTAKTSTLLGPQLLIPDPGKKLWAEIKTSVEKFKS